MNSQTLKMIADELSAELTGRRFGRVFQPGRGEFTIDLRLDDSRYLYIDLRPGDPAIYLIRRRLRDIEKASGSPSPFALAMKKYLSGSEVTAVGKRTGERVVEIELRAEDELGSICFRRLIAQLTGRSANLFLTDGSGAILDRARDTRGDGQQIGETYSPPEREGGPVEERAAPVDAAAADSPNLPSAALDAFYAERDAERRFQSLASAAAAKVASAIRKRRKLASNLNNDLAEHGDADRWKRFGDLLLSNLSTARREGNSITVLDYFDGTLPEIAIDADENDSITEAAEKYFRRYTKARNAAAEVAGRLENLSKELSQLQNRKAAIEQAIEEKDSAFLEEAAGVKKPVSVRDKKRSPESSGVARRFVSSDGFEILVGKRAKDNDVLTFKLAKSLDTWMHAADYPGSHVVVRNPNRKEVPQRTLHEAAQLAAFYSQGKAQIKAAVHYTQKKFVNKPKGAAPGLVSLASFKTLLVVPEIPPELDRQG